MSTPSGETIQDIPSWPTINEAANSLGVSRQYIHKLVSTGRLHAKMRGDVWFLDPESLKEYEDTRERDPGRKRNR